MLFKLEINPMFIMSELPEKLKHGKVNRTTKIKLKLLTVIKSVRELYVTTIKIEWRAMQATECLA
jgi:hypothetical protein